ncbi:MAG: DUF4199 domain-containing protein [Bacteroidota bacterium]
MRPEFKYGFIGAGAICLWMLIEYFLGFHEPEKIPYSQLSFWVSPFILLFPLFRGLKEKVNENPNEEFDLRKGVFAGLVIVVVSAGVVGVFSYFYYSAISPDYIANLKEWTRAQMIEAGTSPGRADRDLEGLDFRRFIFQKWVFQIGQGIMLALIVTLYLRRKQFKRFERERDAAIAAEEAAEKKRKKAAKAAKRKK